MAEPPLAFPAIGFASGRIFGDLNVFYGARDFALESPNSVASRLGMLIVDSAGRCWKISRVLDLGIPGSFLGRMMRWLVGYRYHRLEQDLVEAPSISLDEVKARICESVQTYPDDWRDDEAVAGEDGSPRDEQEMLDELKARVRAAQTLAQVINALWDQDLPG